MKFPSIGFNLKHSIPCSDLSSSLTLLILKDIKIVVIIQVQKNIKPMNAN